MTKVFSFQDKFKKIKFQVNKNKITLLINENAYNDFKYMNEFKNLKKRIKFALECNEQNHDNYYGIARWSSVSNKINCPTYGLFKINNITFIIEQIGGQCFNK